jgi:hypothetical protein
MTQKTDSTSCSGNSQGGGGCIVASDSMVLIASSQNKIHESGILFLGEDPKYGLYQKPAGYT